MKFTRLVFPGIAMIASSYGLARFSYGLLLPDINESLAMTEFASGVVSALFYLSYCFMIVISTVLTTRDGPRVMILAAGALAVVGMAIMSAAPSVWLLALGVLFAGGSTGLVSPPYGAAISLWIRRKDQGRANTWINSGTSIGIVLTGLGAILLTPHWRLTYLIYTVIALIVLYWSYRTIPKSEPDVYFDKGQLSLRGADTPGPLVVSSFVMGISSAAFWTFSRSFIEAAGTYTNVQSSGFWIMIGLFGMVGGISGGFIEKAGLQRAFMTGGLSLSAASIILAVFPEIIWSSYLAAALFGASYIFLTGVILVWGIRVFYSNASLGIAIPFLLLAVGQVAGSPLAGGLIAFAGYETAFLIFGLIGIAGSLVPTKERPQQYSETP
ncbi:MFS transporter [Salisediminibacterium halotolerans]|uniref:MFS transporter n=1 Tax=Salisediminibacterium halotolerans TaxID=517425 RepID=UPI000EB0F471|nr:MFS transporter [Salisediminibacterium halotolerans]RLJ71714.1 putative MFS family arabinose efflux permease [Actinophytocola xinjiangensis]RPE86864.1 putative MFS family arabinose efflux permease [Salisediminibacterium halotolerans]TWG32927.1 putative MFS family arabinose efflux permease [Salisediminibacterium halotolerans]GEL07781.1 MFS transporter [Salisediminibacterium halotolerans]